MFLKKRVQISHESVKLLIAIEKDWIKVKHVQILCTWLDEVKIAKFFKYTVQFLLFHLIKSV